MEIKNNTINQILYNSHLIFEVLGKDNVCLVGGSIRDAILNSRNSYEDLDYSTILTPEEVIEKFKSLKDRNIIILSRDKEYGTITIIDDKQKKYEITTTREDILCNGRDAKVKFCRNFKCDSMRRDFTINALYLRYSGDILDFHGGLNDLQNKAIKFIGNAEERIIEDYLRIVRYFRFLTVLNGKLDSDIISIIKKNISGLKKVSKERIRLEIFKILSYNNWHQGISNIIQSGLSKDILGIKISSIPKLTKNQESIKDPILRLMLLVGNPENTLSLKESLKLTNKEIKILSFLNNNSFLLHKTDLSDEELIQTFKIRLNISSDMQYLITDKVVKLINLMQPLPLNGDDIKILAKNDQDIGCLLNKAISAWIKSEYKLTKKELINIVANYIDNVSF